MHFSNPTYAPLLFLLTTAWTVGVPCAAMSEELSSGEYFEMQSWSQEQECSATVLRQRAGELSQSEVTRLPLPPRQRRKCRGRNEGLPEATRDVSGQLCHGVSRRLSEELEHRV